MTLYTDYSMIITNQITKMRISCFIKSESYDTSSMEYAITMSIERLKQLTNHIWYEIYWYKYWFSIAHVSSYEQHLHGVNGPCDKTFMIIHVILNLQTTVLKIVCVIITQDAWYINHPVCSARRNSWDLKWYMRPTKWYNKNIDCKKPYHIRFGSTNLS